MICSMITFKLDDLLWAHRKTAEQVRQTTGISAATISNIRNNKNLNISVNTLDKLCKYFHCRVGDIIEYVED